MLKEPNSQKYPLSSGEHQEPEQSLEGLVAELRAIAPKRTVEPNSHNWKGMDGCIAWHFIERAAVNWPDVGFMMSEWLQANLPPPGQLALSDAQIIALRKDTRAGDPTKPWGDTLAFARALLAEVDPTRQLADLQAQVHQLQRFKQAVELLCAQWRSASPDDDEVPATVPVLRALNAMREDAEIVRGALGQFDRPMELAPDATLAPLDVIAVLSAVLKTNRPGTIALMREAVLEADATPDLDYYRGPLRTPADDPSWIPRAKAPPPGARVRVLMDAGHVGNPAHPGYPHGKWEEVTTVGTVGTVGYGFGFMCELAQTGSVTHWQPLIPGQVLQPGVKPPVPAMTPEQEQAVLQALDEQIRVLAPLALPRAEPVTQPQPGEQPDGYVVWQEDSGSWHGMRDRDMAEAYAQWHRSEAQGFRLLPKQPPLPNNPYLTRPEKKDASHDQPR